MKADEELRRNVMDAIKSESELLEVSSEIGVAAKDGVITLAGWVDSYSKKIAAENAAQRVPGVTVVACDLKVKVGSIPKHDDLEIAENINKALKNKISLEDGQIRIKVDERCVYLDGHVGSADLKKQLEELIWNVAGVRGVTSNIGIELDRIDVAGVQREIASEFQKLALKDGLSIKIKMEGDKIVLEGKVNSIVEKNDAETIAKNIHGVTSVINQIVVES